MPAKTSARRWVAAGAVAVLTGLGIYGISKWMKPAPGAAEFRKLVSATYWAGAKEFSGDPGARVPIADGQPFGATLQFQHTGVGGKFEVGFYCDVAGNKVWAGPVDVNIPDEADWTTHTVKVSGTYNSHGLEHCRLVDTVKVLTDEAGGIIVADDDAESYHNITKIEFRNLVVQRYYSPFGNGLPGARIPIADGQAFAAKVYFEYRYLGGAVRADVSLKVGAVYERARADFTVPNARDWTAGTVEVSSLAPFDKKNLEHCALIDTLKELWGPGNAYHPDGDAECYHCVTKAEFRDLVAEEYRSPRGAGGPRAKVPIAHGDSFGGRLRFEYRYLGGQFQPGFYLNVEGYKERAAKSITLPNAWAWTSVKVDVSSIRNYDSHGLGHCRLIDCVKYIYSLRAMADVLEDGDTDCYHNILAQFRNLTSTKYWSEKP